MAPDEQTIEPIVNPSFTEMHLAEIEALLTGPGDEDIVNEQDQNEVVNEEDVKTTEANG